MNGLQLFLVFAPYSVCLIGLALVLVQILLQLVRRFIALAIFRTYCPERASRAKLDNFCHKLEMHMLFLAITYTLLIGLLKSNITCSFLIYNRCNVTSMKAPPIDVTCSQSWHYVPVGGERETKTMSSTALTHVKY